MVTFGSARTIREPLRPSYQGYPGGVSESVSHGEPGAILSFLKTWMDSFAHGPAATRGEGEPSRRPGTPACATSHGPERRFQRVGVPVAASVEPGPAPSRGLESARGVGLRGLAHGLGELERRPELGGPAPPGGRGPRRPGVAVRAEGRGRRAATDRVVGTRARAGRNCRRRTRT